MSTPPLLEELDEIVTIADSSLVIAGLELPLVERLAMIEGAMKSIRRRAHELYLSMGGIDHWKDDD